MRAVQVIQTTGPSGVELREIPDPELKPGQVIVRVHSVGVAFPDLLLSKGQYQMKPEIPFTLGVDIAGTVEAVGEGVTGFEVGQRVSGVVPHGGASDLVALPSDSVFPLPDALSYDEGAALPMNYLTVEFSLYERGGLQKGENVLVLGAAGGVGTAAIQVAKGMGANVVAVVSSEEKAGVAREAGADEVVVLSSDVSFRDQVKAATNGQGIDVIVDPVGGDIFTDALRTLRAQGRLLVVGFAAGSIPEIKVNRLLLNNIDVRGVAWGAYAWARPGYMREQWDRLVPMIENGTIRPTVGATYPLEQFTQALEDLDGRKAIGKLVVQLQD